MSKENCKTPFVQKVLVTILIQIFFSSNIVWGASINQHESSASNFTLATYTQIPDSNFKEKVMAMDAVLTAPAENTFLAGQIKSEQQVYKKKYKKQWKQKWLNERTFSLKIGGNALEIEGRVENNLPHLTTVKVVRLNDVLQKTGQFAHVGLIEKDEHGNRVENGVPVIYVDNKYYKMLDRTALKHDVDEIIQWEQLRLELSRIYGDDFDSAAMRNWIQTHTKVADDKLVSGECAGLTSVEIAKKFHKKSFPLKKLLELIAPDEKHLLEAVDFAYVKKLYDKFKHEEGNDVNISASVSMAATPTMESKYQHYKRILPPGKESDQLVFGTSGIRELVKFLVDKKCYALADGLIYYFAEMGELTQDESKNMMAIAGDLRPSTDRILLMQIAAAMKHGIKIINGGNIPTPAIVNYGMHNPIGAIISLMITASHCPVLPKAIEQNGIKPNRSTGEVLKEDERRILKQVREALEIECMRPEEENMFTKTGNKKDKSLSKDQKKLLDEAMEMLKTINDEPAKMFVDRYAAFGNIFDQTDKVPFIEHMAVGRDLIKKIFNRVGLNFFSEERNKKWQKSLVVDTENVTKGLKKVVKRVKRKYKDSQIKGMCTTDGDSDRPALFDEKGNFIYGDKTGYFTCEYIRNLTAEKHKKMFVAVTATVSRAVVQRLKDIGCEVVQTQIGSPFVVKAMEDRLAQAEKEGEEVIACGFERNGGFLLGSDITLDNGNVLEALPTRDAMLPILATFHLAKNNGNMTLGQLEKSRFSEEYASFSWSDLIQNTDPGCESYTAVMGQAIMRSFSPIELDIVEVEFLEGKKIRYTKKDGTVKTVGSEDEIALRMNKIKDILETHFTPKKGFEGGIEKMGFLDGVRMFFNNACKEVVHMRPSGNAAQWRIYSEARTQKRAEQITDLKSEIYPKMIEEYTKEKKKYEGMRITPRTNLEMKQTFKGVEGFDLDKDVWRTWDMKFGSKKEHSLEENIVFGGSGDALIFQSRRIYDVTGELKWLPKKGYNKETLTVSRFLGWERDRNVLSCAENWSDGRKIKVEYKGFDAWLELGRGLGKNIPMGKFADMPFPVMSDRAKAHFVENGIYWLDLFDVVTESQLAAEPPMWQHNFKFERPKELNIPEQDAKKAVTLFEDGENGILPNITDKNHKYIIRYDKTRLQEYQSKFYLSNEFSPESILNEYVTQLKLKVPAGKDPEEFIKLKEFDGKTEDGKEALISVEQLDGSGQRVGTGNVNITGLDSIKQGAIRIVGMLNMAMAASGIPDGADLSKYTKLVSYISDQYKLITNASFDPKMLFAVIIIPAAEPIPANRLREYYELTLKNLQSV
ncbi:MAG: hypothetical protein ABIH09_00255 [Candidatus Omnitrophota bacterium]